MTFPEHIMAPSYQSLHIRATVAAGATQYRAQAPLMLAIGRNRDVLSDADRDAEEMDGLFLNCPVRQWAAAAQAAMSIGGDA